jgi:hypothetical protein
VYSIQKSLLVLADVMLKAPEGLFAGHKFAPIGWISMLVIVFGMQTE